MEYSTTTIRRFVTTFLSPAAFPNHISAILPFLNVPMARRNVPCPGNR
jgi:hypothetical protein